MPKPVDQADDPRAKRPGTGTLGKAMATLSLVCDTDEQLRFTDILARSGQPRGTLHRQLSHLVEEGLLEIRGDQVYAPGPTLLRLASFAWARNDLRLLAEPHLQALHALTGETVHLGILRGHEIIYLDKVEGRQSIRMYSQIGRASPLHCTGIGKAALSALADQERERIIAGLTFRSFTPQTLGDAAALRREIEVARQEGYAFDREEHEGGIHCVAAPIVSQDRSFAAGISVTAPVFRVPMKQLADWAPAIRDTGLAISREMAPRLGPRPSYPA